MKTQIVNHPIAAMLLAALMLAGFTPELQAQHRTSGRSESQNRPGNSEIANTGKATALVKKEAKKETDSFRAKPGKTNRDEAWGKDHRTDYNRWDKTRDHRNDDFYKHKKRDRDIHVHPAPRIPHPDVFPRPHIRFRQLPRTAVWVSLDGEGYFLYHKKFYKASPFGYYRVHPPRYIQVLPEGCQLVWLRGRPAFRYFGVHFVKTPFGFEIFS